MNRELSVSSNANLTGNQVTWRKFISRKNLLVFLAVMSFVSMIFFFGLRWIERNITFHPARYSAGTSWALPVGAEDVWFTNSDGLRLNGWFFKAAFGPSEATVIYFHGNGGNISNVGWVGTDLAARGFDVLLMDYRGYGRSEGEIQDERGIYSDADAAYDYVVSARGIHPETVVLYGQSLGTTAVADLASRKKCGAIVLESGLSSASEMAVRVLPWLPRRLHVLGKNRFESARKLSSVHCPVLITHGDPDPEIPTAEGRKLFAAANDPKKLLIFPGAGHNVFGSQGDLYLNQVTNFIQEALTNN